MNSPVLLHASEAERLLTRMEALALDGVAALQSGDAERLLSALEEREVCRIEAGPHLDAVHAARDERAATGGIAAASSMEPLIEALLASAQAVRAADERLTLALAAQSDQLARELDRLDEEVAVRSAYGQAPPRTRALNIVR